MDRNDVSMLTRREIEARIAAPLIKVFQKEIGERKALTIVDEVIRSLAKEQGAHFASHLKGNSLAHWVEGMAYWMKDDALTIDILEENDKKFAFNVRHCRYADMYRRLGIPELGYHLSCKRDASMIEGFNPHITFRRSKTLMEGADLCDFIYEVRPLE
jgi:hypothetical protein